MPRFFFHIKQGAQMVMDQEGSVLAGAEEAHSEAVHAAREICAEAIKNGGDVAMDAVIIAEEEGRRVKFIPLADLLAEKADPCRLRLRGPSGIDGEHRAIVSTLRRNFEVTCTQAMLIRHLREQIEKDLRSCERALVDVRRQLAAL